MSILKIIKNIVDCDEIVYEYSYHLIETHFNQNINDRKDIKTYGIEVGRKDIINGQEVSSIKESIKYISPYKNKVDDLINMLHEHCVSPIHLVEVIGEYVDEWVVDFDNIIEEEVSNINYNKELVIL